MLQIGCCRRWGRFDPESLADTAPRAAQAMLRALETFSKQKANVAPSVGKAADKLAAALTKWEAGVCAQNEKRKAENGDAAETPVRKKMKKKKSSDKSSKKKKLSATGRKAKSKSSRKRRKSL